MKSPAFAIPRSEPRIHVNLPVRLRFGWKWSEEITAEATEISAQGMRVRWNSPLRLGLDVEAALAGGTEKAKCYRVIWVRDADSEPHVFEMGFALNNEITAESAGVA